MKIKVNRQYWKKIKKLMYLSSFCLVKKWKKLVKIWQNKKLKVLLAKVALV